jgi:hemerythrin-like domain-containing protein
MLSLRATTQDHHAKLLPHVDRLLDLAEMIGQVDCSAIHELFDTEYAFVVGQLVPHIEAIETTLYGRLEQLLGHRHSLAPMRQEHDVMRQLIDELGNYRRHAERCSWDSVEGLALRRALYRLHSILKVHLAEEELYLTVLDRSLSDAEKDLLARGIDHAMAEPL